MKLDVLTPKNTVIKSDDFDSIEYTIAEGQGKLLFNILSQYSNPIGSLIREVTTNAFDSHIEAGIKKPVDVAIKGGTFTKNDTVFSVTDYGVGLSPERVKTIYSKFLASTKRDSNEQHGAFGLGSKSPLSYCDMFYVTTVHDGVKYTYIISKGQQAPEIDLVSRDFVDMSNRTTIEVPIKSGDKEQFKTEIRRQLQYFDNIDYENCGYPNTYKIYRGDNFMYRPGSEDGYVHIVLGKVYYPIDFNAIPDMRKWWLDTPIALRFDIGDLPVVWNRENIEYTSEAVYAIKNKLELAKKELQELWDERNSDIKSMEDYVNACIDHQDGSVEIIDGVRIPNVKNLIDTSIKYSKYKNRGVNTPADPFFDYTVKKKVSNGLMDASIVRMSVFNTIKNKKPIYIYEGKAKSIRNKFIDRMMNMPTFYLVEGNKEDVIEGSTYYSFGVDRFSATDKEKAIINEFRKEVHDYMESAFPIYENITVTDEFREILKSERKKPTKSGAAIEELTDFAVKLCKVTEVATSEYKPAFSRERIDFEDSTNVTYVYGTNDDTEALEMAALVTMRSEYIKVIKVAVNKIPVFEGMDNTIEVNEFLKSNHKELIKNITSEYILDNYQTTYGIIRKNVVTEYLPKEIQSDIKFLIDYGIKRPIYNGIINYIYRDHFTQYKNSRKDLIDHSVVNVIKEVETFINRHLLLEFVNLSANYIKKDSSLHVGLQQYVKPNHINVYLLNRLYNFKNKEDNNE